MKEFGVAYLVLCTLALMIAGFAVLYVALNVLPILVNSAIPSDYILLKILAILVGLVVAFVIWALMVLGYAWLLGAR